MLCSCSCIHRAPEARVTATEVSPDSPPRPPGVVSGFAPRCSVVPTEWPAGPRHISPPQKSHVISLGQFLISPTNVAIPTMPIQCLKGLHGNYVRNCWAHNIQPGSRTCPASPHGGNCIIRTPTRRRHAANQLLMLQNPHRSQPEVHRAAPKTGTVPVGAKKLAQHGPSSGSSAK